MKDRFEDRPHRRLGLLPDDVVALDVRPDRATVKELAMLKFCDPGRRVRVKEIAEWLERNYVSPHGRRITDGRKAAQVLYQHGSLRVVGFSGGHGAEAP